MTIQEIMDALQRYLDQGIPSDTAVWFEGGGYLFVPTTTALDEDAEVRIKGL